MNPLFESSTVVKERADRFGRFLSLCCAIHCLLMPVALAVFPFWLGRVLGHSGLHLAVVCASVFLGAWAFWRGSREHGRRGIMALAVLAGALVLVGELFLESAPWQHAAISASAGLALAWGHHKNLQFCRDARCDCPAHVHGDNA